MHLQSLALGLVALVVGCSPGPSDNRADSAQDGNHEAGLPSVSETGGNAAPNETPPRRASQYSSLQKCSLVTSAPDEAGYKSSTCPGVGGYALRLVDADARQNLFVKLPSGNEHSLALSEAAGSGFSRIGDRIEWRGTLEGGIFRPDAMVVRYFVVEKEGDEEIAYLLPVALNGDRPCVTARVAPGPSQSNQAREMIDRKMPCLDSSPD